jgi:hypothetical protein
VRLGAAVAVVLALALGVTAALPTGATELAPGQAAATECLWKKRAKRVVKRVRRHGRLRKVVRWKPGWACVPQVAVPVSPPLAPAPPAPSAPEPTPEPELEANRLAVKSAEYYFILSRPSVQAGEVTIELNNRGEDPHNLNVREEGDEGPPLEVPETQSLERSVATFDLPAGSYRLWCSLPEHEERGMYTSLQVE